MAGIPKCPEHLDDEAKSEWMRISQELLSAGLLTMVDRAALAGYCQSWSDWTDATLQLTKEGKVYVDDKQARRKNPYFDIAYKAKHSMKDFLVEFGMTPSSRSRITASMPPPRDKLEEFLNASNKSA